MKIYTSFLVLSLMFLLLSGCATKPAVLEQDLTEALNFSVISPEVAKSLLEGAYNVKLVDVRTLEEHVSSRIPDSILLPYDIIEIEAADKLPNKNDTIIVYCRTGRRSAIAAQTLVRLGYSDVRDLGGIVDWPYETISGE